MHDETPGVSSISQTHLIKKISVCEASLGMRVQTPSNKKIPEVLTLLTELEGTESFLIKYKRLTSSKRSQSPSDCAGALPSMPNFSSFSLFSMATVHGT